MEGDKMKNKEVAKILNEIAELLELQGIPFKPAAYRKAAQSIENLSEKLIDIAARGELEKIPGIGEGIAKRIQELLDTGRLKYLEDLRKETQLKSTPLKVIEKVREFEVDGVIIKARITEKYERITVRDSKEFIENSLRTVDIGKPGYSKLIRGRLKRTREWATATYLISREIKEETKDRLRSAAAQEIKRSRQKK
jgi:DNA polymerase/3'-5' exonuclease PolX